MNLAAKHNIEVSLRPTDTVVLTIVNIEERQVRNADGSTMNADVLIGLATESGASDYGTRHTVRLNNVTAGQRVLADGETAICRRTQESPTNVFGWTSPARIAIERRNGEGALTVKNDGQGFDVAEALARGLELQDMRERAEMPGGKLDIESQAGAGTSVKVRALTGQAG